jgi:hypothetical protein
MQQTDTCILFPDSPSVKQRRGCWLLEQQANDATKTVKICDFSMSR